MFFIVNPTAARGRAPLEWAKAQRELSARGVKFTERRTTGPGEATEISRQALLSGETRVIAVGGDGTLNEVVRGYFDSAGKAVNPEAAVGLLPCGTGSDFRRTLGLKDREAALRAIINGKTRQIDLIQIELAADNEEAISRYSVNLVSFGLGGEVVKHVNSWRGTWPTWIGGQIRFAAAALKALKCYRNRPVLVRLNGELDLYIFSNFIVAANGKFAGGGMKFAPKAQLDDGLVDVVLTHNAERRDVIKELPGIRRGAHLRNPKVRLEQAREVTIKSWPALPVDIDGEAAGYTPARLIVKPAAIRFIVGEDQQSPKMP